MKKTHIFLLLCMISFLSFAQKEMSSVVKNRYNIQIGLGLWANNETRLSKEIALRSEVGFNGGYQYENGKSNIAFVPGISLEPRWYFNLKKRLEEGKNIVNYWSLKTFYLSDSFIVANNDELELERDQLRLTVNWGLVRNLSERWNYEFGIGLGANLLHEKNEGFFESDTPIVGSLTLRFGVKL